MRTDTVAVEGIPKGAREQPSKDSHPRARAREEREQRLPFGELALLKELVTRDQLEEILHIQATRRGEDGKNQKIATLFVRQGILSRDQARLVLQLQKHAGPIAGYHLTDHLGTGGMGAVFRAIETASGREVALKVLPPSATHNERFRARFLREAAVSQQLDHQHLVKSFGQGESDEHLYFAMELVPGQNAREMVRKRGALPEAEVRALLRQITQAMAHYWQRRVVHRDIKPENILVTPQGVAKLTDLGLCRQLDDATQLTRAGKTLGTPLYISPELARGLGSVDIRSDLYSLGATFFHLATGVPPFDAAAPAEMLKAHVEQAPPSPRLKNARLSEGLDQLLLRLLEKRPERRPQDPEAVLAALDRVERGQPPFPEAGATPPPPAAMELSQDFDVSDDSVDDELPPSAALDKADKVDKADKAQVTSARITPVQPARSAPVPPARSAPGSGRAPEARSPAPPRAPAPSEVSLDELGSWSESSDLTESDLSGPPPESSSAAASPPSRTSPGRAVAERPLPPRPGTTARRANFRAGSSATRVATYAGQRRRSTPLAPLASVLGFLVLFALGVFLGSRARTPASARQPDAATQVDPTAELRELAQKDPLGALETAHAWARKNPQDPSGAVARFEVLVQLLPDGTPGAQAARVSLGEARRRLEDLAGEAVDTLAAALCELVEKKQWAETQARLRAFPPSYRGTAAWDRYEELRREVERLERGAKGK